MAWLDDFLSFVLSVAGARVTRVGGPTGKNVNLSSRFKVTINASTGDADVDLADSVPSPTLADAVITGSLQTGPTLDKWCRGITTTGPGTSTLASLSLPSGSVSGLDVTINAVSGSWWFMQRGHSTDTVNTLGGGVTYTPNTSSNFPIWPSTSGTWSADTVTLSGTGPTATITGCADNGSGNVRVTVSGGVSGPLSSTLTGLSVTVSGVTGTTEANGAHIATRIDATNFDIPVAFVNAYVSGGSVVLTTPTVVTWSADVSLRAVAP